MAHVIMQVFLDFSDGSWCVAWLHGGVLDAMGSLVYEQECAKLSETSQFRAACRIIAPMCIGLKSACLAASIVIVH